MLFSNREGGIILLGVKDDREILGVNPDAVDRIKKDFVTSINNGQKIYPPLYLQPEVCTVGGRVVICIRVPAGSQVCRHHAPCLPPHLLQQHGKARYEPEDAAVPDGP